MSYYPESSLTPQEKSNRRHPWHVTEQGVYTAQGVHKLVKVIAVYYDQLMITSDIIPGRWPKKVRMHTVTPLSEIRR